MGLFTSGNELATIAMIAVLQFQEESKDVQNAELRFSLFIL